jgi:hypothetical protein
LFALSATFATADSSDFSLSASTHQQLAQGPTRAFIKAAVTDDGSRWEGFEGGLLGRLLRKPIALFADWPAAAGALCVFINRQGAAGRWPSAIRVFVAQLKRRTMLRRNLAGIIVLALLSTAAFAAQIKEMPRTPVKPINAPKAVDINSGTANDFVTLGIDAPTAKKIVDGRPYRSKRDLITRQILTSEQYDKFKTMLVARRPASSKKNG